MHLHEEIEKVRLEMYVTSKNRSLNDPIVVSLSQKLDLLLNKLNRETKS